MLSDLSCCRPRASCIVDSSIENVWAVVRGWHVQSWITEVDNMPVFVRMVEMFERLVALDDETHSLKWRLISHPETISPFPAASYVNFVTRMSLREVTHGDHAYVDWEGEFFTEHEHAQEMLSLFQRWFEAGLKQLQAAIAVNPKGFAAHGAQRPVSPAPLSPAAFVYQQQPISSGYMPSASWETAPHGLPVVGRAGPHQYPPAYSLEDIAGSYMQNLNLQGWGPDLQGASDHHGSWGRG